MDVRLSHDRYRLVPEDYEKTEADLAAEAAGHFYISFGADEIEVPAGAFVISQGLIIGDIVGIGIVLLQKYTGIITLDPQTYYVTESPMELNIPIIVLLNVVTLFVSISVLIIPTFFISHIHPAKSMRYE